MKLNILIIRKIIAHDKETYRMTKKEEKRLKAEYSRRLAEVADIRMQLRRAYAAFDNTTDCDLMDACIYEINALKSRYNSAVVNAKNLML